MPALADVDGFIICIQVCALLYPDSGISMDVENF